MSPQSEDDDRTVIRPAGETSTGVAADAHALPIGTRLGEFELTAKIGEGGFSIVYLAWDHSLQRKVALKEYMPTAIAARSGQTTVLPRSERHRETFEAGLKSFINEGRLLAQFDHASLVKVYRFWEANGTAYMIMPFYEGVTLRDTVRAMPQQPDEAWLLKMLAPLTDALCVIHADQCYHRDIAPDNVILLAGSGRPLLLDFGAARRVIGDMTHALTVILKPGYAPVEQYAELPDMKQGPWTDVYALAATVYWAIMGKTPPPAVGRMLGDTYQTLGQAVAGRYSERFLQAIDRALLVRPEERTQTIESFRADLGLGSAPATPASAATRSTDASSSNSMSSTIGRQSGPAAASGGAVTAPPGGTEARAAGRGAWWLAGLAVLGLAGGAVWFALKPAPVVNQPDSKVVPAVPVASPPAAPLVADPAPAPQADAALRGTGAAPSAAASLIKPTAKPVATPALDAPRKSVESPPSNRAECASLLQRMSLGDASPELLERLKALHCK